MRRALIVLAVAIAVFATAAIPAFAQGSADPTCAASETSFLVRMRCLLDLGVQSVTNLFSRSEEGALPVPLVADEESGVVFIPRAGLKEVRVVKLSEDALVVPRGMTSETITFGVPETPKGGYQIEADVEESGATRVQVFTPLGAREVGELCASLGATRCYVATVGKQGVQKCIRDSDPDSDTFKKLVWREETECKADETCKAGSCAPVEDLSDYSPKGFGAGTTRTVTIDLEALKEKYPQLKDFGPEKAEQFFVHDADGNYFGGGSLSPSKTVQGKDVFSGAWHTLFLDTPPGKYFVMVVTRKGGSVFDVDKVLAIDIPESGCALLYGDGDPKNLDLTILGDGFSGRSDFFSYLGSRLDPFTLANFDIVKAYSNKLNIWAVDPYKNVGCRIEKAGSLISHILGEDVIQCDEDEARAIASSCPDPDKTVVISTQKGGTATGITEPKWYVERVEKLLVDVIGAPFTLLLRFMQPEATLALSSQRVIRGDFVWLLKDYADAGVFWHEMGHAFGGIIDYYIFGETCENFPSIMCDSDRFPHFSDEKLSRDKYFMVTEFNKSYCAGTIEASRPYPNPYNPTVAIQSCRNDCQAKSLSGDCESYCKRVKIQVRVRYPADPNENTCYATFEVYNSAGKLVRTLVSKEPLSRDQYDEFKVPTKNYVFEWDGKDFLGYSAASGPYFFKVGMRSTLTKNSQDGQDLKIILVK